MFDSTIGRGVDLLFKIILFVAIVCVPLSMWKGIDILVWIVTNIVSDDA